MKEDEKKREENRSPSMKHETQRNRFHHTKLYHVCIWRNCLLITSFSSQTGPTGTTIRKTWPHFVLRLVTKSIVLHRAQAHGPQEAQAHVGGSLDSGQETFMFEDRRVHNYKDLNEIKNPKIIAVSTISHAMLLWCLHFMRASSLN